MGAPITSAGISLIKLFRAAALTATHQFFFLFTSLFNDDIVAVLAPRVYGTAEQK